MLRVEAEQLDLRRFELLVRDGHRAIDRCDHEAAVELLDRALALWRGSAPRPTSLMRRPPGDASYVVVGLSER